MLTTSLDDLKGRKVSTSIGSAADGTLVRALQRAGIDPSTGHYFDDTRRYIDAAPISGEQRSAIFAANPRRVYPRLAAE